ncbi:MAG: alpha/beta fold hydrolase [Pseudomonadota bacterium]
MSTETGPLSIYVPKRADPGPLVLVTHGFAGSRQMMQYISRDLARGGFAVASMDFAGQGRSTARMSSDVTRIEGTTEQLMRQTLSAVDLIEATIGRPVEALVGHSMATDIVIRASEKLPEVAGIVAISMYSEKVSADFPSRLLILSGEWETRLRVFGRSAIAQIDPEAREGQTVRQGDVVRRAVSVPRTEHVAVLFSPVTLEETHVWISDALNRSYSGTAWGMGVPIAVVLVGLIVLFWPVTRGLGPIVPPPRALSLRAFLAATLFPVIPALAASVFLGGSLAGSAAFGGLFAFLLVWSGVAWAVLWRVGYRPHVPHVLGVAVLVIWGFVVFALALDRYAAAFVPAGSRLELMVIFLTATVPFMAADRALVAGAPVWRRLVSRAMPVAALLSAMLIDIPRMGLLFTVLPVLVLFFAVYGTMGRAVARRTNPETAALGLGVILAWSIAASTPLFVG